MKDINSPFAAGLPKNDLNNFSPRVGFAFDITDKGNHIVRGGWGMYFGQTFQILPLFMLQQANDTVFTQTLSLSSNGFQDPNFDRVPSTSRPLGEFRFGLIHSLPLVLPPPNLPLAQWDASSTPTSKTPTTTSGMSVRPGKSMRAAAVVDAAGLPRLNQIIVESAIGR